MVHVFLNNINICPEIVYRTNGMEIEVKFYVFNHTHLEKYPFLFPSKDGSVGKGKL